jgi:uncharacterized membrane protein YgcG
MAHRGRGAARLGCGQAQPRHRHLPLPPFQLLRHTARHPSPLPRHTRTHTHPGREAFLSPELVASWAGHDRISSIRDAYTALKLCCWVNTLERRHFSAPYETKDCTQKFDWFLPRFAAVLQDPESGWEGWQQEYTQVGGGGRGEGGRGGGRAGGGGGGARRWGAVVACHACYALPLRSPL